MKFLSETKKLPEVFRAASTDESRARLMHPELLIAEDGTATLAATDSYILVSVPVEVGENDVAGPIPADTLKEFIRAQNKSKHTLLELHCEENRIWFNGIGEIRQWERHDVGPFPNIQSLIPAETTDYTIGLNPKLLLAAAQALGSPDEIRLRFTIFPETKEPNPRRVLVAEVPNGEGSFALVMPKAPPR